MLSDFVALSLLPVSCWPAVAELLRDGLTPAAILERTVRRTGDRRHSPSDLRCRARAALDRSFRAGIHAVAIADAGYPPLLAAIPDPPPVLWVRGSLEALRPPAVAIVGSRAGSPYALEVASRLAADLVPHGIAVVSGLARGVDSAAHRGALGADGITIAVLGCGADVVYPREHASLTDDVVGGGGAIASELCPGTPPRACFFPRRNRIISGLSRAIVIVEAGEKSGSLITARAALDQGRDVLAVPGNVLTSRNRGGHALIRDGARVVESAADILDEIGLAGGDSRAGGIRKAPAASTEGDGLLRCLTPGEPCGLDALAEATGLPASRLLPRLLDLELQGRIRRVAGAGFLRI